jgi:flavodoxin
MATDGTSKVLVVYFTYSGQAGRLVEAIAGGLAARGCSVTKAKIELTDSRYTKKLTPLPLRHPALAFIRMFPAQMRRATGEIGIPPEAQDGDYDLVVFVSPTWWLTTNLPIRSYLESPAAKKVLDGKPFAAVSVSRRYWKGNVHTIARLGEKAGGRSMGEHHFLAAGGQVKSMLSWLSWMKHAEVRERVFGLEVPPPNLQPSFEQEAATYIDGVADRALGASAAGAGT